MKNSLVHSVYRLKVNSAKSRKGQLGLSILGALLALVIGALLTIPVVNAFLDSQRKTRVEANLQDMRTIIADVQRNFGNTNQYAKLTTAIAVQSSVVPQRLRVTGTNTAQNSYNGDITFTPTTVTVANDSTTMRWNRVPRADCADISLGIEQLARGITVTSNSVKPNDGVIDAGLVGAACDAGAEATIDVVIGRKG